MRSYLGRRCCGRGLGDGVGVVVELRPPWRPPIHGVLPLHDVLPLHGVLDLGGGREDKVRKRGRAVRRRRGGGTRLTRRSNIGATAAEVVHLDYELEQETAVMRSTPPPKPIRSR